LELRAPITLNATHFALPAPGRSAAKPAPNAKPAGEAANRPPITLTCDGHATFTQHRPEKPAPSEGPDPASAPKGEAKAPTAPPARRDAAASGRAPLPSDRTLVRPRGTPKTNKGRWRRPAPPTPDLEDDATPHPPFPRLDAGGATEMGEPVTFGLLGGEGG